jgi:hypothetical protein
MYFTAGTLLAIGAAVVRVTMHISGNKTATDKTVAENKAAAEKAVAQTEAELKEDLAALERRLTAVIDQKERDGVARAEVLRQADEAMARHLGEIGNALRTKIHDFETWSRDEFVRKGSFELVVGRLETKMENIGSKIEAMPKMVVELARQIAGKD